MFININETRINTDHIVSYEKMGEQGVYISMVGEDMLKIKEVDVEKTLLQLDRILNPKHIDIFEVKK
jgi:hypothetical protein